MYAIIWILDCWLLDTCFLETNAVIDLFHILINELLHRYYQFLVTNFLNLFVQALKTIMFELVPSMTFI